ncbi:MAG: hypothetical protein KDA58_17040, partial [Planctomycetaceae bacterium]|nr:hypothetical protein [Planctomycetaceae bacterium]
MPPKIHEIRPEERHFTEEDQRRTEEQMRGHYDRVDSAFARENTARQTAMDSQVDQLQADGHYISANAAFGRDVATAGGNVYDSVQQAVRQPQLPPAEAEYGQLSLRPAEQFELEANADPGLRERSNVNKVCLGAGLAGAFVVTGGAIAAGLIAGGVLKVSSGSSEADPDGPLTPKLCDSLKQCLEAWLSMPEEAYWQAVLDYLNQNHPSYMLQFDAVDYVSAIAHSLRRSDWSSAYIEQSVKTLLTSWRKAGVAVVDDKEQPLTDELDFTRNKELFQQASVLKDEQGQEATRYWKLRILSFVLACIVTPPRLEDDDNENFSVVGDWDKQTFGTKSGQHWHMTQG